MMTRLLFTAIGKVTNPNTIESEFRKPGDDADYTFKTAILVSEIILYESYIVNPKHPYYQYKGPLTRVGIKGDYERMLMCTFEEFDTAYQNATSEIINFKHN